MDLQARHAPMRSEFLSAMAAVMDSGKFAGGPFVERFEEEFAAYCGTKYAIGVGSGTEALWLTLVAMGIGPGDEVITVPLTFVATVEAILLAGAKPVFVDIDPATYTMDPSGIAKVLTAKTKAILPVHLFGQPADIGRIMKIASAYGLSVIEDAAQAHGAEWHGRKAGSLADAGCFSFYPGKNLGGFGEGGAVTTDDADLAGRLRVLRDHGQPRKNQHAVIGWNGRMDGLQAAVLSIKLRHLDTGNRIRKHHARNYRKALSGTEELMLPGESDGTSHAWHIYALRVSDRNGLLRDFQRHGIGYGLHYPVPVHRQPAYRAYASGENTLPLAEQCADELVSLPVGQELTDVQVEQVIEVIHHWTDKTL
jgi:dTDP-4-amino-4,6-dideoxygalactose transaminase